MKYIITSKVRTMYCENVFIIGNIDNGGFIGLDREGIELYNHILNKHEINTSELNSNMKELINAALELEILSVDKDNKQNDLDTSINTAYLHITNRCNLHCIGCYSLNEDRNKSQDLSLAQIKIIIDRLREMGVSKLNISGGEPFLRNDLPQIVYYAKDIGIEKIYIGTNGTCVDSHVLDDIKEYVDLILVAVDGFNLNNSQFIRDVGSYSKTIDAIKTMKEKGVNVSILPTIHRKNYMNIKDYLRLSSLLETPISFSVLTCNPNIKPLNEYVLTDEEFSRMVINSYKTSKLEFNDIPGDLSDISYKESCGAGKHLISIDSLGNVYPCHMLHYEEFYLGNVLIDTLPIILATQKAVKFRQITVDNFDECTSCTYKYFCGGGCKARRFLQRSNIYDLDYFCKGYLYNFKKIGETLLSLNNDMETN